jgi:hypothetical protein
MLAGNATGEMLPAQLIIRCDLKDDGQQDAMRVLHNLLGALPRGDWELKHWTGTFQFHPDKPPKSFNRQFLINANGDVITAQNKAWMDSCGLMMWLQLLVVPWAMRNGRRPVVVWDNFEPHSTVVRIIRAGQWIPPAELCLAFEFLPPNCTKWLQVMDLVVNGTLKAAMRRLRLAHLYEYFQDWRFAYLQKQHLPPDERPKFTPLDIKLKDGVQWFFAACSEAFASASFRSGMVRSFCKVGLLRRPHSLYYDVYPFQHPNSYGKWVNELRSVACLPSYEQECGAFYLGDLFDDLALTNSNDSFQDDDEASISSDEEAAPMEQSIIGPAVQAAGILPAAFTNCTIGTLNLYTSHQSA